MTKMEQQFDSVDSNAPAPLLFEAETDESDDQLTSGSGMDITNPVSQRSEPKLSLSKYQYVRSLSSSGETTQTAKNQDATLNGESLTEHVNAVVTVVNVQNGEGTPKTSTPVRPNVDIRSMSTVGFSPVVGSGSATSVVSNGEFNQETRSGGILKPHDIRVPLVGFEVMEQRSRFTIFKLHVHKGSHDNWFVFRRYTDFVQLQKKLKSLFPIFRLALPPKRWFRDNYEKYFLEERLLGLQAFIDSVLCHSDICNSAPAQEFFCLDDPPGPHDSLEESRAYCERMEETVYNLRKDIRQKDTEMELLKDELSLYKSQVEMLSKALREKNTNGATNNTLPSPASSLAECDLMAPEADQSLPVKQPTEDNQSKSRLGVEADYSSKTELMQTSAKELSSDSKKPMKKTRQDMEKGKSRKHSGMFSVLPETAN